MSPPLPQLLCIKARVSFANIWSTDIKQATYEIFPGPIAGKKETFMTLRNGKRMMVEAQLSDFDERTNIYIYILIIVYLCRIALDAFAERGIYEGWTNQ